jgi:hypothetical protein
MVWVTIRSVFGNKSFREELLVTPKTLNFSTVLEVVYMKLVEN